MYQQQRIFCPADPPGRPPLIQKELIIFHPDFLSHDPDHNPQYDQVYHGYHAAQCPDDPPLHSQLYRGDVDSDHAVPEDHRLYHHTANRTAHTRRPHPGTFCRKDKKPPVDVDHNGDPGGDQKNLQQLAAIRIISQTRTLQFPTGITRHDIHHNKQGHQ